MFEEPKESLGSSTCLVVGLGDGLSALLVGLHCAREPRVLGQFGLGGGLIGAETQRQSHNLQPNSGWFDCGSGLCNLERIHFVQGSKVQEHEMVESELAPVANVRLLDHTVPNIESRALLERDVELSVFQHSQGSPNSGPLSDCKKQSLRRKVARIRHSRISG